MITVSNLSSYITGTTFLISGYTGIRHQISSPISVVKYHLKKVLVSLLYLNSESAKKWVQGPMILHLWSWTCWGEHVKGAVLPKYEHLLVCNAELSAFFVLKKIISVSLISSFPMIQFFWYIVQYKQLQKASGQFGWPAPWLRTLG